MTGSGGVDTPTMQSYNPFRGLHLILKFRSKLVDKGKVIELISERGWGNVRDIRLEKRRAGAFFFFFF